MLNFETVEEWEQDGLAFRLEVAAEGENPNEVFGIWEPADGHDAGRTVQHPNPGRGGPRYWVSCNYTPAELAANFAAQGRENPSREAYESLQRELVHYTEGDMVLIRVTVERDGCELAEDQIDTDWHPNDQDRDGRPIDRDDEAREVAGEHFDYKALAQEAKEEHLRGHQEETRPRRTDHV